MVWVVKFRDGTYSDGGFCRVERSSARKYDVRREALVEAARCLDSLVPRIVRLEPRAAKPCHDCAWSHWKEIEVRKAERKRIADKFADSRNDLYFKIQAARQDGPLYGTIRDAILAFTWPEPKP